MAIICASVQIYNKTLEKFEVEQEDLDIYQIIVLL